MGRLHQSAEANAVKLTMGTDLEWYTDTLHHHLPKQRIVMLFAQDSTPVKSPDC